MDLHTTQGHTDELKVLIPVEPLLQYLYKMWYKYVIPWVSDHQFMDLHTAQGHVDELKAFIKCDINM